MQIARADVADLQSKIGSFSSVFPLTANTTVSAGSKVFPVFIKNGETYTIKTLGDAEKCTKISGVYACDASGGDRTLLSSNKAPNTEVTKTATADINYLTYYIVGSNVVEDTDITFVVTAGITKSIADIKSDIVELGNHIDSEVDGLEEDITALDNNIKSLQRTFTLEDLMEYATDAETCLFINTTFNIDIPAGAHSSMNMIVSAFARYENDTNDDVPVIRFYLRHGGQTIYDSREYTIGVNGNEFAAKEWRVPPFEEETTLRVKFTIPSTVNLYIKSIGCVYDNAITRVVTGYRPNAHTAMWGNFCTRKAFEMSAKVGFPCCIVVPKRTSDGVWVCFHDDSNIGNTLIDSNEDAVEENSISDVSWATLQTYTYPTNKLGYKQHVPTLEDFFVVCAKTGMAPMLSCHPVPTSSEWAEIKALAVKTGVMKSLNIKMAQSNAATTFADAYAIFGTDIDSYTVDVSVLSNTVISDMESAGFDLTKVRVGVEYYYAIITQELVSDAIAAGFFAACVLGTISSEEKEALIRMGVTEVTEYSQFSHGLNW